MSVIDAYIFDIETLRDSSHRQPMMRERGNNNFVAFAEASKDDKPLPHMIDFLSTLRDTENDAARDIVFFSGLPEKFREVTVDWLHDNLRWPGDAHPQISERLFMRPNGQFKHDLVVKPLIMDLIRNAGFRPVMIFEQRATLAGMWREAGIPAWSQDASY